MKKTLIFAMILIMLTACSQIKQSDSTAKVADKNNSVTTSEETKTEKTFSLTTISETTLTTTPATTELTTTSAIAAPAVTKVIVTAGSVAVMTKATAIPSAAAVVTTVPATTAVITTTTPLEPTIPDELSALADEIFRLTNVERVNAGMPELGRFTLLDNIAQCRAVECAQNQTISHTRPDGREFKTVLEDFGLKSQCSWWSENVGSCSAEPTAKFAVDQWMNSQGHKENILRDKHTHVGIGVSVGANGWYYYTQAFIQLKQ